MKGKIYSILILLLITFYSSNGQAPPTQQQTEGTYRNIVRALGGITADSMMKLPTTRHIYPGYDSAGAMAIVGGALTFHNGTAWVTVTGTGTVTSVGSGTGLLGGPITGAGTLQIDSNVVIKWDDTLPGNHKIITKTALDDTSAAIRAAIGGSGVTSVGTGYGLTGGPITSTGTIVTDTATLFAKLASTFAAGYGLNYGTRTYKVDTAVLATYIRSTIPSGSGTVSSVATDATLSGGPITTTGTLGINLGTANTWTANITAPALITTGGTSTQFVKGDGSLDGSTYLTTISGIAAGGDLTGTYVNPTIGVNKVTYAKMQAISGSSLLLGSSSSGTAVTEISLGSGLSLSGATLSATGSGGTVTSVSGTANRITSTGGATPIIDISAAYVGQTSITTLGDVTAGTIDAGSILKGVTMTIGSDATGDVYYRNSSGILTRLAIGAATTVFHGGTIPAYGQIVNVDITNGTIDLTAKVTGLLPSGNVGSLMGGQVGLSGLSATGTPSSSTFLRGDNTWSPAGTGTITSVSGTANQIGSTGGTTPVISILSSAILPGSPTVATPGTAGGSIVTIDGSQTLTNKSISYGQITGAPVPITTINVVAPVVSSGGTTPTVSINAIPATSVLANTSGGSLTPNSSIVYSSSGTSTSTIKTSDANANVSANNYLVGVTSVATAAGTTTATISSANSYLFTGTTTQTFVLPLTSSSTKGVIYYVTNTSTGAVTVQANGGTSLVVMAANSSASFVDFGTAGASTDWQTNYQINNTLPAIAGNGRLTGLTAASTGFSTATVGGADASYWVSANVNITTSTTYSFTVTCTYTDETNISRSQTEAFMILAGTTINTISNVTAGAVPLEGVVFHIRCKAGTTITWSSAGTFTAVTYNVEGLIQQDK